MAVNKKSSLISQPEIRRGLSGKSVLGCSSSAWDAFSLAGLISHMARPGVFSETVLGSAGRKALAGAAQQQILASGTTQQK